MKKYILCALLTVLILSCENKDRVRISGLITIDNPGQVYLERQDIDRSRIIDSAGVSERGQFRLNFTPAATGFYNLTFNNKLVPLLVAPGEEINIGINEAENGFDYTLQGSPESLKLKKLNDRLRQTRAAIAGLIEEINETEAIDEARAEHYMNQYDSIINLQRRFSIEFVLNNINSMASIYALYQTYEDGSYVLGENKDIQFMKLASDSLMVAYPLSRHVKAFYNDARKMIYRARNPWMPTLSQIADSLDSSIPNLKIPDTKGDTVLLKQLLGKYVLLHFWASWHQGSRQQMQNLLSVYNAHHTDGFEVYSVSMDYDREAWVNAIRFEEAPWINVSELNYPESYAARVYNVQELPANFLIDPEGNIIAKDIGMRELNRRLTTLLNE